MHFRCNALSDWNGSEYEHAVKVAKTPSTGLYIRGS